MPTLVGLGRWRAACAVAVVCCLALVAGCSSGGDSDDPAAATVDGTDISQAAVQSELQAEVDAAAKAKSTVPQGLYADGADRSPLSTTDGKQQFSATAAASKLTNLILDQILTEELDRLDVKVTAADRTAAEAELCQDSAGCLDAYPAAFKKRLIAQQGRLEAYKRAKAKASTHSDAETLKDAQAKYDQLAKTPANLDQVCFLAAQFPDEATANSIKAQVEAGGDLKTLTAAVPGAKVAEGGESCPLLSGLGDQAPAELQAAQPGSVLVVQNTGSEGYIVLDVTQRRQATFDQLKDDLISAVKDQQAADDNVKADAAVKAEIGKLAKKASIKVNADFGKWDAKTLAVVAPGATPATTTTEPTGAPTIITSPAGTTPSSTSPP